MVEISRIDLNPRRLLGEDEIKRGLCKPRMRMALLEDNLPSHLGKEMPSIGEKILRRNMIEDLIGEDMREGKKDKTRGR